MENSGSYLSQQYIEDVRAEAARRLQAKKDRDMIILEVLSERYQQDRQWGGAAHDDQHGSHDWIAYLSKHLGKAVVWPFDLITFRKQMVRVAALAVAAIEWADRRIEADGVKNGLWPEGE